jgi:hypothetical protein
MKGIIRNIWGAESAKEELGLEQIIIEHHVDFVGSKRPKRWSLLLASLIICPVQ